MITNYDFLNISLSTREVEKVQANLPADGRFEFSGDIDEGDGELFVRFNDLDDDTAFYVRIPADITKRKRQVRDKFNKFDFHSNPEVLDKIERLLA